MKNALLISGPAGTGKNTIAALIAHGKTVTNGQNMTSEALIRKIAKKKGTDIVLLDEVTNLKQIEMFLPFISGQPIALDVVPFEPVQVSPFFLFISQQVRVLPENFARHVAHFHLKDYEHGELDTAGIEGSLPPELVKIIDNEMAKRQQIQALWAEHSVKGL